MFTRKVPIYEPYLILLISRTWEKLLPNDEFLAPAWICHDPIWLHIKPQWTNTTTRAEAAAAQMDVDADEVEEEDADEDSSAGYSPSSSEPSCDKKLKNKMKALFCMQAKGQYRSHVAQKESRRRGKRILRTFVSRYPADLRGSSRQRQPGWRSRATGGLILRRTRRSPS